jgi:tetratricopeptide (TPR) repeat protein
MNQTDTNFNTQPNTPLAKPKRRRAFLLNTLLLLVLIGAAVFGGYQSGIATRKNAETSAIIGQLGEQFQYALVDIEFGRYEIAKQRLEFIIEKDPTFPGAQEKLTEVLVKINTQASYVPPTVTPAPTSTPDFSGAEQAYTRAQQLIAAQDWAGALAALDELRKLDPTYNTSQVDGMYYFALRNNGYELISKGNLEGGIYYITLAERFGTLDSNANGVREGARVYLIGASFWEISWEQAVFYFTQALNWGNLWDGTMTASERYWYASMRYGDELFAQGKICEENEALVQYNNALRIAPLDKAAQANYDQALLICFPPTATLDPFLLFTPTPTLPALPTAETPTPAPPTDTPPPPSDTPTP